LYRRHFVRTCAPHCRKIVSGRGKRERERDRKKERKGGGRERARARAREREIAPGGQRERV
jgi:hypothetical protein